MNEPNDKIIVLDDYRLSEQLKKANIYGAKGNLSDNDKVFFKRLLNKTLKNRFKEND